MTNYKKVYKEMSFEYYDKKKIIELIATAPVNPDTVRKVLTEITRISLEKPLRGIYLDLTSSASFSFEAIGQALKKDNDREFVPLAVTGSSSVLRVIINYLGYIGSYDVKFFINRKEAMAWLITFEVVDNVKQSK